MKINLLPKTDSGKWSAILSIVFIILIAWKLVFPLTIPTFFIAVLGLAGLVAGIIAAVKKDWALLVFFLSWLDL